MHRTMSNEKRLVASNLKDRKFWIQSLFVVQLVVADACDHGCHLLRMVNP